MTVLVVRYKVMGYKLAVEWTVGNEQYWLDAVSETTYDSRK